MIMKKEEVKDIKKDVKVNPILSQEVTASQFSEMIGLNDVTKFWVKKAFKLDEVKTAKNWLKEFKVRGAIEETPNILK
jgi:hypothetical protein